MQSYWHRQTSDKPLFPELLWSRPENKRTAGKLLIIGGNVHGFAAVGEAYNEAQKAGIGSARIILPSALQKTVGKIFPEADFVSSTPSGSFAKTSLAEILAASHWADGVLLAGDLGRNSETAIMLESFTQKYRGQLTITKDAADYFTSGSAVVANRSNTTLVISLAQLQKLALSAKSPQAFTFGMDMLQLVEALHEFTGTYQANIAVKHLQNIFVAAGEQVSSTKLSEDIEIWRVKAAAHAAVWWLQNPSKTLEALTTSLVDT